jgi:hypothetical protein
VPSFGATLVVGMRETDRTIGHVVIEELSHWNSLRCSKVLKTR